MDVCVWVISHQKCRTGEQIHSARNMCLWCFGNTQCKYQNQRSPFYSPCDVWWVLCRIWTERVVNLFFVIAIVCLQICVQKSDSEDSWEYFWRWVNWYSEINLFSLESFLFFCWMTFQRAAKKEGPADFVKGFFYNHTCVGWWGTRERFSRWRPQTAALSWLVLLLADKMIF